MQVKRIKCPNCGIVLDVQNSKNESVKQITCPKCKSVLQVKFPPQQEPMEAETYIAPKPNYSDDGATQLAGGYGETQLTNGGYATTQLGLSPIKENTKAKLLYGGESYELEEGQNIVGRHGQTQTEPVAEHGLPFRIGGVRIGSAFSRTSITRKPVMVLGFVLCVPYHADVVPACRKFVSGDAGIVFRFPLGVLRLRQEGIRKGEFVDALREESHAATVH